MKTRWLILAILISGFMPLIGAGAEATPAAENPKQEAAVVTIPPDEEVAVLETSKGDIVLRFFPDVAPRHVLNFKKLAKEGFYNGTKFHRVIPGFMIQGGDPNTKQNNESSWGTGGPGYKVNAEFSKKPHVRGTLSMARSADPNSAGSQFFICHARASNLDGQYTVFGETVVGLDVVDKIATAPTKEKNIPVDPVAINKAGLMRWEQYQKKKDQPPAAGSAQKTEK